MLARVSAPPFDALDLQAVIERGRRRWPAIAVPLDLEAHVRRCAPAGEAAWLASAAVEDLYLACACLAHDEAALAVLEREVIARVAQFVAHLRVASDVIDEVKQVLRERLLVAAPGREPRLAEYAARGPLGAWIRVMAVRIALDLRRARPSAEIEAIDVDQIDAGPRRASEAEADYVKRRYGVTLQAAITRAIAELSAEQRALLKLHFVDGATFDQLAQQLGLHKVTVWRRIAAAREAVVAATFRILSAQTAIPSGELESILRTVQSQLHVTL